MKKILFSKFLLSFLLISCALTSCEKNVYLFAEGFADLFPNNHPQNVPHTWLDLRTAFRKYGYELIQIRSVHNLPDLKALLFFNINSNALLAAQNRIPKEKLVAVLFEPATVNPDNYNMRYLKAFSKVFTWNNDLVDNKHIFQFYLPSFHYQMGMRESSIPFEQRKLSVIIAGVHQDPNPNSLYGERFRTIQFFESNHPNDLDVYGRGPWDRYTTLYRGEIHDKISVMHKYKFAICYENTQKVSGYISEKIFDCFLAGCVPVYWGAENITNWIPENCFIDRRKFDTHEQLYDHLINMKKEEYENYINNIRLYFNSEEGRFFEADYFINLVVESIIK